MLQHLGRGCSYCLILDLCLVYLHLPHSLRLLGGLGLKVSELGEELVGQIRVA
ncbi:hypothetical protein D3C86_2138060 [compost metagenome]